MGSDPTSLGLDDLRPPHLAAFRGGVGVEGHILRLERGGVIAVLLENTAEGGVDDAFSRIGAGPDKHDRSEVSFHGHAYILASIFSFTPTKLVKNPYSAGIMCGKRVEGVWIYSPFCGLISLKFPTVFVNGYMDKELDFRYIMDLRIPMAWGLPLWRLFC